MKKAIIAIALGIFFTTFSVNVSAENPIDYRSYCRAYGQGSPGYFSVTIDGEDYLCFNTIQSNNKLLTDQGKSYIFNQFGRKVRNTMHRLDGYNYYATEDGSLLVSSWYQDSYKWSYFDNNSRMVIDSFVDIEGKSYYFDNAGIMKEKEWFKDSSGKWFYAKLGGSLATEWEFINGKWYYFESRYSSKAMAEDKTIQINNTYYSFSKSGAMISNDWKNSVNGWRYHDKSGKSVQGWNKIGNKWSYFGYGDLAYQSEKRYINNSQYVFDKNAYMLANQWYRDSGEWYYLSGSGKVVVYDWVKTNGKWSFFDYGGVVLSNTTERINGFTYGFDSNGYMKTNQWQKGKYGDWYYLLSNGKSAKGWRLISNKWYYFDSFDGEMYSNRGSYIDGKYYEFNSSGVWVK